MEERVLQPAFAYFAESGDYIASWESESQI